MRCKYCHATGLEWVNDRGKFVLYDPSISTFHNCKHELGKFSACPHGILLDRVCDLCEEDRRELNDEEYGEE